MLGDQASEGTHYFDTTGNDGRTLVLGHDIGFLHNYSPTHSTCNPNIAIQLIDSGQSDNLPTKMKPNDVPECEYRTFGICCSEIADIFL